MEVVSLDKTNTENEEYSEALPEQPEVSDHEDDDIRHYDYPRV